MPLLQMLLGGMDRMSSRIGRHHLGMPAFVDIREGLGLLGWMMGGGG